MLSTQCIINLRGNLAYLLLTEAAGWPRSQTVGGRAATVAVTLVKTAAPEVICPLLRDRQ